MVQPEDIARKKVVMRAACFAGDVAADIADLCISAYKTAIPVYPVLARKGEDGTFGDRRQILDGVEVIGDDASGNIAGGRRV